MNKRSVLAPVKKSVPEAETPAPVQRDLDDKEIFALPEHQKAPIPETIPEDTPIQTPAPDTPPTKQKKTRDYSHLTKAREKSLEARRKKAEEKNRLQSEVDAYKEKLEFERLSKKFNKSSITQNEVPTAPPAKPTPKVEYEPPIEKKTQPVPQSVASVNPHHDMSGSMIDYDRLIGGVADRLSQQNSYYTQLENDIRMDERKKAEATYQEQLKAWEKQQHRQHQREQAYGAMSSNYRRNQVFDRSSKLRDTYTQRYKNNWYSNY